MSFNIERFVNSCRCLYKCFCTVSKASQNLLPIGIAVYFRSQGVTYLSVAIFVILALSFVPASFLVYLVEDRVSKSKHLQLVSGLNPIVYWTANFTWDLVRYTYYYYQL